MITQGHSHEHSLLSYLFVMARWLDVKNIKMMSLMDPILAVIQVLYLPPEVARGAYFHGRDLFVVMLYFSACIHLSWL